MKKIIAIGFICIAAGALMFYLKPTDNQEKVISPVAGGSIKPSPDISINQTLLFVPYWTIDKSNIESSGYDGLVYFGIRPDINGIDVKDDGYKNMIQFLGKTSPKITQYVVIRFLDSTINFKILENKELQKKIIQEAINFAKENSFKGIVLDLEVSSLPFDSVVQEINNFTKDFYAEVSRNNLEFYIALYGDVFYRIRPYDVSILAKHTDGIFVMAYDFHKAKGNPGPSFPLSGKEIYGYDFKKMIEDYTKIIRKEKLIVVFGMFGYDWKIDDKNQPLKPGEPVSLLEIKNKFIDKCAMLDCSITRDEKSTESNITYTDKDNIKHVVWYEDMDSIEKKKKFLKEEGINSTAFWAYSYF